MGPAAADPLSDLLRFTEVSFDAPERWWLGALFLPVLLLAPLARRRAKGSLLPLVLRAGALLCLLAVILEPSLEERKDETGRLLVLADVSPSVGDPGIAEAEGLLGSAHAPFDLVPFGAEPRFAGTGRRLDPDPRPATDIAAALRLAAARAPPTGPVRIVLLSDGRPTTPGAEAAALQLRRSGREIVAMGLGRGARDQAPAIAVTGLSPPETFEHGAPFSVEATVNAAAARRAHAVLYLDGVEHAARDVDLEAGDNAVAFGGLRLEPGRYLAQVWVEGDATPSDNIAATVLAVPGTPRVLCLAARERRALIAEALALQGMQVQVAAAADARDLAPFDLVVLLPDAPAEALEERATALAGFLGAGGGLLAVGGSEGPGLARLHGTPTAFLLPVSVEPRPLPDAAPPAPRPEPRPRIEVVEEETDAYPITLCLVVDRSGSMRGPKIVRAKQSAAAAAIALTPEDRVAVVVFGDEAEVAVAPRPAADASAVLRILAPLEAQGQTAMYEALQLAYLLMEKEESPIRHIVLVSDGIPTRDGAWRDLVVQGAKRKITLSAVGIGWDIDRFFLAQLTKWGQGRYWSATHPHEIPQVVTQDTKRIVSARDRRGEDAERPLPKEEPEPETPEAPEEPETPPPPPSPARMVPDPAAPREMLKGIPDDELPSVGFIEKSEPRFAAWVAVRDEQEGRPLVAYRRVGLGTAAALLVDPEAEAELKEHALFPRLMAQLARSVLPDIEGVPLVLEHRVQGRRLEILLRGEDGLPRTDLPVEIGSLEVVRRADRYEATLPPSPGPETVTVRVGELLERSFVVPPSAVEELRKTGVDRNMLLRLAGDPSRVDPPPERAFDLPVARVTSRRPLPFPFLFLAAILLPLDAWARRRVRSGSR